MYEELLEDIGMTKSEISVYFALLDIGPSTTGPIIKRAGIASGKAYIILDKLILKGLVTYVIKSGVKYYQAKDPERLIDYIREKEDELKEKEKKLLSIIPFLKNKYNSAKYKPIAEIYEGVKGFKTFYEFILKRLERGDEVDVMGAPKIAMERFEAYIYNWNKKRIKLGIKMRIIYNHDCKEFGKKREKMRLTKVRYMKKNLETPTWTNIFKDYVAIINVHGNPVCFLIKNDEAAKSYRNYFEFIWKNSEK